MIALHTTKLVEIFVNLDDFVKKLSTAPEYTSERIFMEETQMSKSELMTIVVFYHHAGFGCMKWYDEVGIGKYLRSYFPKAFSYSHFVNSLHKVYRELILSLFLCCMGKPTEANYLDSKRLEICYIKCER